MKGLAKTVGALLCIAASNATAQDYRDTPAGAEWLGPRQESVLFDFHGGGYRFESGESVGGYANPQYDLKNSYSLGLRLGYAFDRHFESEMSFDFVPTDSPGARTNFYLYGLNLNYNPLTELIFVPYLTAGAGAATFAPLTTSSNTDGMVNYGGGLRIFLFPNFALRLDARVVHTFSPFNTNVSYTLGVSYYAMVHRYLDSDHDGVYDQFDKCPRQPGRRADGCPETSLPEPLPLPATPAGK